MSIFATRLEPARQRARLALIGCLLTASACHGSSSSDAGAAPSFADSGKLPVMTADAGAQVAPGMSAAGASGASAAAAGQSSAAGAGTSGAAAGVSGAGGAGGAAVIGDTATKLFAAASGGVEVFVNGTSLGKSMGDAIFSSSASLTTGADNVIVLRASRGSATAPAARLELDGPFGKVGTSDQWKAKTATGSDSSDAMGPWISAAFDDSSWDKATVVAGDAPAMFPSDGPAVGVWTKTPADTTVLLRLVLYVPADWSPDKPTGFGNAVTGGEGGEIVEVSTTADLVKAVAGTTPRIVQVVGTLDFTGSEGTTSAATCYQMKCPAPKDSEYITNQQGACDSSGMTTFDFTYDKAGTTPLAIGSNKTIIGVGANAIIKGKGFTLSKGVSNIIIRNLSITGINPQLIWGGDAITIDDADRVWIDHVHFSLIGRQMIVTGFGKASNVTLSWNEFDGRTPYAAYCDGTHYWVWLILGAADTITIVNNWVHDTSGRAPHAGGLKNATNSTHIVNNYFDYIPGHAANPQTNLAKLLLEGNYFRQVTTPIDIDTTVAPAPGQAFAPIGMPTAATQSACQAALSRDCVTNIAVPQNGMFPLDMSVMTAFSTPAKTAIATPYDASHVPHAIPHLAGTGHI